MYILYCLLATMLDYVLPAYKVSPAALLKNAFVNCDLTLRSDQILQEKSTEKILDPIVSE